MARELQELLSKLGYYEGSLTDEYDYNTKTSLKDFCLVENLEEHLRDDDKLDKRIIEFIRKKAD